MIYLTTKEIKRINDFGQAITSRGIKPSYGIKDEKSKNVLDSLTYRVENSIVFGEDTLKTPIDKACKLFIEIATHQWFNNGNKRTAILTAIEFLMLNGYGIDYTYKERFIKEVMVLIPNVINLNEMGMYDDVYDQSKSLFEKFFKESQKTYDKEDFNKLSSENPFYRLKSMITKLSKI